MNCLRNVMDINSHVRAIMVACVVLLGPGVVGAQNRWDAMYNVRIENMTVAPRDARTATLTFDISWADSWRDQTNHDAAWVFFKVRAESETGWQYVRLAADKVMNPTGYGQQKGGTPLDVRLSLCAHGALRQLWEGNTS